MLVSSASETHLETLPETLSPTTAYGNIWNEVDGFLKKRSQCFKSPVSTKATELNQSAKYF